MARLLLVVLACAVLYWLTRRATRPPAPPQRSTQALPKEVPMLQCAYCGIHIPEEEIVRGRDGRLFCSRDHEQSAFHAGSA